MQTPLTPCANPPLPVRLSACGFTDIDEQAAALQGWNQRYLQLSAGKFRGEVRRLDLPGIGLFWEDLQQSVHQTGYVRQGVVALGVPVTLQGDYQFCGAPGNASALHVFSGNDGFEFRSPQRHVMLGIEVQTALFESQVGDARVFAARARLHHTCAQATMALRSFLLELLDAAAEHSPQLQTHSQQTQARDELMCRLSAVITPAAGPSAPVHRSSAAHTTLAARAQALAAARLDDPPTVAELCNLLGVSRRTLQNCFHATWGMGPLAWLNVLRLNAVRARLKTAESVTEAATQLGFWHFGHFAHSYQELFGELPSHTWQHHRKAPRH